MKGDGNSCGRAPQTPDDYSLRVAEEVVDKLASDAQRGLTRTEAARRLAENGPNELRAVPPVPVWLRIPMKPAIDSETKPATCSDFIPASIPI